MNRKGSSQDASPSLPHDEGFWFAGFTLMVEISGSNVALFALSIDHPCSLQDVERDFSRNGLDVLIINTRRKNLARQAGWPRKRFASKMVLEHMGLSRK